MGGLFLDRIDRRRFLGLAVTGALAPSLMACADSTPTPENFKFTAETKHQGGVVYKGEDKSTLRLFSEGAVTGVFSMSEILALVPSDFRSLQKVDQTSAQEREMIEVVMSVTRTFPDKLLVEGLIADPTRSRDKANFSKSLEVKDLEGRANCSVLWENWKFQELNWNGTIYSLVTDEVRFPINPVPTATPYRGRDGYPKY